MFQNMDILSHMCTCANMCAPMLKLTPTKKAYHTLKYHRIHAPSCIYTSVILVCKIFVVLVTAFCCYSNDC